MNSCDGTGSVHRGPLSRRAALRFLRCYSSLAMNLESILFTQGFGSRRQCRALIADGRVSIGGAVCTDADADFPTDDAVFASAWTASSGRIARTRICC